MSPEAWDITVLKNVLDKACSIIATWQLAVNSASVEKDTNKFRHAEIQFKRSTN